MHYNILNVNYAYFIIWGHLGYIKGGSLQVTLQHGVHTSPTKYSLYLLYNREHGVIGYITFYQSDTNPDQGSVPQSMGHEGNGGAS